MRVVHVKTGCLHIVIGITMLWGLAGQAFAEDLYRQPGPWQDDQSRAFQFEALRGTPTVLTLAYGACRRICATSVRVMTQLQTLSDQRHQRVNFVVVGLDPSRDRPADWAALREDRKLLRSNWYFLSGNDASTRRLANQIGIRYWRYGEHTMHDFGVVLLSHEGRLIGRLDASDQNPESLLP